MKEEIWYADAAMPALLIWSKQISSTEVTAAFLSRIQQVKPIMNAVVTLIADQAIADARKADASLVRGEAPGQLHGVPFSIKDDPECAGTRTQRGSRLSADHISQHDATAVARKVPTALIHGRSISP